MTRLAALACLLFLLLPTASEAAGRAGTARALAAQMGNAGPSSGAFAVDLDTGRTIYKKRANTPRMPASVEKLYTSAALLDRLGAGGRLATTVYAEVAPDADGVVDGDLFLRGGGDPNLDVIDLGSLAAARVPRELVADHAARGRGDPGRVDLRGEAAEVDHVEVRVARAAQEEVAVDDAVGVGGRLGVDLGG